MTGVGPEQAAFGWPLLAADPRALLDLAALPAWSLRRPRGAPHTRDVLACLLGVAADAAYD